MLISYTGVCIKLPAEVKKTQQQLYWQLFNVLNTYLNCCFWHVFIRYFRVLMLFTLYIYKLYSLMVLVNMHSISLKFLSELNMLELSYR